MTKEGDPLGWLELCPGDLRDNADSNEPPIQMLAARSSTKTRTVMRHPRRTGPGLSAIDVRTIETAIAAQSRAPSS